MNEKNNIIKMVCKELGITQKELADMLDVKPSAVSNWSAGKIPKMVEILLNQMVELQECKKKLNKIKEAKDIISSL